MLNFVIPAGLRSCIYPVVLIKLIFLLILQVEYAKVLLKALFGLETQTEKIKRNSKLHP
jgi:hypothetical protein